MISDETNTLRSGRFPAAALSVQGSSPTVKTVMSPKTIIIVRFTMKAPEETVKDKSSNYLRESPVQVKQLSTLFRL